MTLSVFLVRRDIGSKGVRGHFVTLIQLGMHLITCSPLEAGLCYNIKEAFIVAVVYNS